MNKETFDRIQGAVVGAAVGDALGMPLEFTERRPTTKLVKAMLPGRLPSGTFTDDTEMALAVAENLVAHHRIEPADLSSRFVRWLQSHPADIGIHTRTVLNRIATGVAWDVAAEEVQQMKPTSAGNGSVMRCWPVAIARWNNITTLIHESQLQSRITHTHPECLSGCAFINVLISLLVQGTSPIQSIQQTLGIVNLPKSMHNIIIQAPNKSRDELANTGWIRHTIESVVWALTRSSGFEETLINIINLGGDADTSGTVVGALAGATYGVASIPQSWKLHLKGEYPLGSGRIWHASDFLNLAEALTKISEMDT